MPIRVAIADDEPLARRRLQRFVRAEADAELVAESGDGPETLAMLEREDIDLLFLDVQMPGMDGFAVVDARGPARMPTVVFVTAFDEHAIRAFEVNALDYLLKPVTAERFQRAFQRARDHHARAASVESRERLVALLAQVLDVERAAALGAAHAPPPAAPANGAAPAAPAASATAATSPLASRILIRSDGRVFFVRAADVDWFEAHGNYVRVHVGKTTHVIRETIGALEGALDPALFARIHRSTIVNLDRIGELQPWFAGDYLVLLRDGTKLKLSRTYREQLQQRLQALR
jgi:two-component system, LytTR family, response regulator